jgi:hypothetical protein
MLQARPLCGIATSFLFHVTATPTLTLPLQRQFERFYGGRHKGRVLSWQIGAGTVSAQSPDDPTGGCF